MLINRNTKTVSGEQMPAEVLMALEAEFGPDGAELPVVFHALMDSAPWAALWLALNCLDTETVVDLAGQMVNLRLPFQPIFVEYGATAKACAAQAKIAYEKLLAAIAAVAPLQATIDELEGLFDEANTYNDMTTMAQAILAQMMARDLLAAKIEVYRRTAHSLAVQAAIHGSSNHAPELALIASSGKL